MICLLAILLALVNAFWLVLTVLMLPGNWLMVATAGLVAWWQWDRGMFSPWTLLAAALLAGVGEVLELLSSAAGARLGGAGRWSAAGGLLGALAGLVLGAALIPIPVIGPLLGACAGAFAGVCVSEAAGGKPFRRTLRPALAAGAGRLVGTLLKLAVGVVIWLVLTVASFWP